MGGWMNGWIEGSMNEWFEICLPGCCIISNQLQHAGFTAQGLMNEWMNERIMNEWINERMYEWTIEWVVPFAWKSSLSWRRWISVELRRLCPRFDLRPHPKVKTGFSLSVHNIGQKNEGQLEYTESTNERVLRVSRESGASGQLTYKYTPQMKKLEVMFFLDDHLEFVV